MGIFSEWSPVYHDAGFSPIPLAAGGKFPATKNWSKYCNRLPTEDELTAYCNKHPDGNLGIACGTFNDRQQQLIACDIDIEDQDKINDMKLIIGTDGPAKRGKKGLTIFAVSEPGEKINSIKIHDYHNGKKSRTPMIEILSSGNQTVVPPSIHPETHSEYVWLGESLLDRGFYNLDVLRKCSINELYAYGENKWDLMKALYGMTWEGVGGGGDTHDVCLAAVGWMVSRNWQDGDIRWKINQCKQAACERAGDVYDWPEADKIIQGWVDSARSKGFDEGGGKKIRQQPEQRAAAIWALNYLGGEGHVIGYEGSMRHYKDGYWPAVPDNRIKQQILLNNDVIKEHDVSSALKVLYLTTADEDFNRTIGMDSDEDPKKHKLCLANGTLNLRTGELEPHSPDNQLLARLDFDWDDSEECPIFDKFINETFDGDQEIIDCVIEYFGYCLIPDNSFQKVLFLIGSGGNGKGVLGNFMKSFHDQDCVGSIGLNDLKNERMFSSLVGKLINFCAEEQQLDQLADSALKKITGSDPVTVRKLYNEAQNNIYLTCRLVVLTNFMPRTSDNSDALRRRFIMIPCDNKAKNPDIHLGRKLLKERSAVLKKYLIPGIQRLYERKHFVVPEISTQMVNDYLTENSPVEYWVKNCCTPLTAKEMRKDENLSISNELFESFKEWCTEANMQYKVNVIRWGKEMTYMGYPVIEREVAGKVINCRAIKTKDVSEF